MYLPATPFVTWTICKGTPFRRTSISPDDLKMIIEEVFKVQWDELLVPSRKPEKVYARQVFCYFMVKSLKKSSVKTAALFSQDHTTILYSIKTVKDRLDSKDPSWNSFKEKFQTISSRIQ